MDYSQSTFTIPCEGILFEVLKEHLPYILGTDARATISGDGNYYHIKSRSPLVEGAINELRYLSYKRTHETAFIPPPPAPLQHSYNITYNQSNYNVHLNHPVPTSESHQAVNASFQFSVANSQLLTTQIYINLPHYPPPIPTSVPANYQIPPPPPPQLAIPPPPESCLSPSRTRTASPAASVQSFEYQPLTPCERKVHLVPTGMGRRETPVGGGGRGGWTGRQI